jgi:hypothetical protein
MEKDLHILPSSWVALGREESVSSFSSETGAEDSVSPLKNALI